MPDRRGQAAFRIILIVAAILVAIVFGFMGQLFLAGGIVVLALIVGVAALFSRAKTPTD